jgi:hypothetical protein
MSSLYVSHIMTTMNTLNVIYKKLQKNQNVDLLNDFKYVYIYILGDVNLYKDKSLHKFVSKYINILGTNARIDKQDFNGLYNDDSLFELFNVINNKHHVQLHYDASKYFILVLLFHVIYNECKYSVYHVYNDMRRKEICNKINKFLAEYVPDISKYDMNKDISLNRYINLFTSKTHIYDNVAFVNYMYVVYNNLVHNKFTRMYSYITSCSCQCLSYPLWFTQYYGDYA